MTYCAELKNGMAETDMGTAAEIIIDDNASIRLKNRRFAMNMAKRYLISTIVTAFFGAVYEYFSFGVFSYYMLYAFAFPLVLGIVPWMIIVMDTKDLTGKGFPSKITQNLWGAGITTLTVGAVFHGILDIYGTTSALSKCYFIVGGVLLLVSAMTFIGNREKKETTDRI